MIENRCFLFLQTGNMNDIKNMSLEDFGNVLKVYKYINTPKEKRYKKTLTDSQKEMIEHHKKYFQKNGKVI